MWVWPGFVLSVALAGVAWWRSRAPVQSYYEGEVYGIGAAGHRKYALGFTIGAALFLAELLWPGWIARLRNLSGSTRWHVPEDWWVNALLAYLALTGILYGATFVRGATGEDE
jgi:hypothetical protein